MEKKNEIQELIEVFKGYREILSPVQLSLQELSSTYRGMETDIKVLSDNLNGDAKAKLETIEKTISMQSQRNADLATNIDKFLSTSSNYFKNVDSLYKKFEQIENNITTVKELDNKAKEQIEKLEEIITEKKINYNLKDLQRLLETYDANVQKVSEFINKAVAANLAENSKKIDAIKKENEATAAQLREQKQDIVSLIETFQLTNNLLKEVIEKDSVKEEYVFDILDKWAVSRGLKIKK